MLSKLVAPTNNTLPDTTIKAENRLKTLETKTFKCCDKFSCRVWYNVNLNTLPPEFRLCQEEAKAILSEIGKLLQNSVTEQAEHFDREYISNIFTTNQKNKKFRISIKLKEFDKHVLYKHLK